jgi:hypothetical protein
VLPENADPRHSTLHFAGPFSWCGVAEKNLFGSPEGRKAGVYLLTAESDAGYFIYSAGFTTRSFAERFWEHTKEYLSGNYTVLDAKALREGTRLVVWDGFWDAREAWQRLGDFRARSGEILAHVHELLATFRLFLAPLSTERRVLERLEAAIMNALYGASGKIAELPDRGMRLLPRRQDETPLKVRVESSVVLCGLPATFEA